MQQKAILTLGALLALLAGIGAFYWSKSDFTTLDGEQVSWSDLQGQVVVINFFAEWCAPCLRELPELNQFASMTEGQNIRLYGVSFDRLDDKELEQLRSKFQIKFPLIKSEPPASLPIPRPQALPATFIIGPDGRMVRQLMGEQHAQSLLESIRLLKLL